jgi:hypothetical protein
VCVRSEPFLAKDFDEACKAAKKAAYTAFLVGFVYDEHNKSATQVCPLANIRGYLCMFS